MKPRGRRSIGLLTVLVTTAMATDVVRAVPLAAQTALSSVKSSSEETTMGDLVADAVRGTANAQVALVAANELKPATLGGASLSTEQLEGALRAAQDTSDTVVVMTLTGTQLRAALERGVSHAPIDFAGFLQVSGLRVAYDPSKPQGHRVLTIVRPDGSPITPTQTVTVATTRLLSDGALGYFEVWPKDAAPRNTGVPFAKSMTDYVIAHQPLSYRIEGRVTASQ